MRYGGSRIERVIEDVLYYGLQVTRILLFAALAYATHEAGRFFTTLINLME